MSQQTELHPLRIEEIKMESINFPLFFANQSIQQDEMYPIIDSSFYITGMTELDANGVPTILILNRETGSGIVTQSVYQLISSNKHNVNESKKFIDPSLQ